MKILLVAINAKYIHSNLAVYSLKAYAEEFGGQVVVREYTVNHRVDFILQELYKQQPDVLCFSCYIWNLSFVCELSQELHRLRPQLPIWAGGPEVSFKYRDFLEKNPAITGVMRGEGEATFLELCRYYVKQDVELSHISGLAYRIPEGGIRKTEERSPLSMDEIPFCYGEVSTDRDCFPGQFENRILYYESSRGCPFQCSYCLSSLEKSLRFRSLDLVKRELLFFLERHVPQVKFVDRTFNCKPDRTIAIWQFLKEHDNGVTNFHFEISADLLHQEEILLLQGLRPGLVQLEIGVQSTNPRTLKEIRREMDLERLEEAVKQVKKGANIHQHLDLIAGLPYEDFHTFCRSFDRIYRLHPQQLQLGFLKVLKGTYMEENKEAYGMISQGRPPYEVMATKWLSYGEIIQLKQTEEMLEVYYNSGQFEMTMRVLEPEFESPFDLYQELGQFYEERDLFYKNHSRMGRCEILLEFARSRSLSPIDLYQEALTFDLYHREHMKRRPVWAPSPENFRRERKALCKKGANVHVEPFYYEWLELTEGIQEYPQKREKPMFVLFDYEKRDEMTGQALVSRAIL